MDKEDKNKYRKEEKPISRGFGIMELKDDFNH